MLIRKAHLNDLLLVMPLMEQLGYPQDFDEFQKKFELYLNDGHYGIAVAESEHKIVGLVAYVCYDLFVTSKKRFRIEGLIVDQAFRGKGVGKALMEYVENLAKEQGSSVIDLTSGTRRKDSGSHIFYEKLKCTPKIRPLVKRVFSSKRIVK